MPRIIRLEETDAENPALAAYTAISEQALFRMYEPARGLFIAESVPVVHRALDGGCVPVSVVAERLLTEEEGRYRNAFEERDEARVEAVHLDGVPFHPRVAKVLAALDEKGFGDIPAYAAPLSVLERFAGFHLTGGVMCAMKRPEKADAETFLQAVSAAPQSLLCVLDRVTNPTNVGAIFRSAAALHTDALLVTDSSADPLYRRALRTGMGAPFFLPWTYVKEADYVDALHAHGFSCCAMALTPEALPLSDPRLKAEKKLALIFGNEGYGLRKETIRACDHVCKIPMSNGVDSLNVAAASAVAFWELGGKRREDG